MAHQAFDNDECDYETPSGLRLTSMKPTNVPPTQDGDAGDKTSPPMIQGHLDYGSDTATPNDVLMLLGAGQPYGAK